MTLGGTEHKPRLLLLADRQDWSFDAAARAVASHLHDEFELNVSYVTESPDLSEWPFDLIHVFFWGEQYHHRFLKDPNKVIKEISSHRWENETQYGCLNEREMASRYLADAATITTTSLRLYNKFSCIRDILYTPNGIDPDSFFDKGMRRGPLKIGWAGNIDDPCKGVSDIIIPALQGLDLRFAPGDCSRQQMLQFYNSIDVLCVASTSEGEPLTLLEGMACGCFPLCVDVGIVPELIDHLKNGLIVPRRIDSFRSAASWCESNLDKVRSAGRFNAQLILATRTWAKTIPFWRAAFRAALQKASVAKVPPIAGDTRNSVRDGTWHNNLGNTLLEWPERAEAAGRMLAHLPLRAGDSLIDLGSGHQTLRRYISSALRYVPVDRVPRTADTVVLDLNQQLPEGQYAAASMLGLIEYLKDPLQVFLWIAQHARYCLFSYSDCSDEQKRKTQHWQSSMNFAEIEAMVRCIGGRFLQIDPYAEGARLYLVEFREVGLTTSSSTRKLALLSAGVNRTNCGDALIEDAIRRILKQHHMSTFPLLRPLSEPQIEEINSCDAAIICGTNLYQSNFACALTPEVISKIRIPVLPFGVGASAPIGEIPRMEADGVKAVRSLHDRCVISSVRDPASLTFIRSLGISNVALTGCPVLFHALTEPVFSESSGNGLFVSVRARLLHVDQGLVARKIQTLDKLSKVFRPVLVLASPQDVPLAQPLVEKYGLQYLLDHRYTAAPLTLGVQHAGRTAGFRLHFGMLSLAYGKHTTLVGSDTRVSEFCKMMGIGYHDVHTYSDEAVIQELLATPPSMATFLASWRDLRAEMAWVLRANGLANELSL